VQKNLKSYLELNSEEYWEQQGIEFDRKEREAVRGVILPSCPWLDAAERMVQMIGRPAAVLTKLFADQLDLYSLSPQEAAHEAFKNKIIEGTEDERNKLDLTIAAYTGEKPKPIPEEVVRWAAETIEEMKYWEAQTYEWYKRVGSMPRFEELRMVDFMTAKEYALDISMAVMYVPLYDVYLPISFMMDRGRGEIYGVYKSASEAFWAEYYKGFPTPSF